MGESMQDLIESMKQSNERFKAQIEAYRVKRNEASTKVGLNEAFIALGEGKRVRHIDDAVDGTFYIDPEEGLTYHSHLYHRDPVVFTPEHVKTGDNWIIVEN